MSLRQGSDGKKPVSLSGHSLAERRSFHHWGAAAFFLAYLAIQVWLPARTWFQSDTRRYAWLMFSGRHQPIALFVIDGSGRRHPLSEIVGFTSLPRWIRYDLDAGRFLSPLICEKWPWARAVAVRTDWTQEEWKHPCQR